MLKENSFIILKYRKLFVCAILGWIVSLLGTMADSIIAGVILDSDAVAAVNLVAPILDIFYFFTLLLSRGVSIRYSQTIGAFKYEHSRKVAGMGVIMAVSLSVFTLVTLMVFKNVIIGFYGVTGNIRTLTEAYFEPIVLVATFYPIQELMYYLVYSDGDEKIILMVDIITAVANTVFSFILVNFMGIAGLGYGTLISGVLAFLCTLTHFLKKNNSVRFKFYFSLKELWQMLKVGSAFSMMMLYMAIVDIVFNKFVIVVFSERYLAVYAVINLVLNFAAVFNCSINAGSMFINVAYGEGNNITIKRVMKISNKCTLVTGAIVSVAMMVMASFWPRLYGITESDLFSAAVYAGRIIPVFFIAAAFTYTYFGYYPQIDKVVEGNIMALLYMFIGPIVLAIPLALAGGFDAMALGFALTPVFTLVGEFIYILLTKQLMNAPYLLDKMQEKEVHFDYELTDTAIVECRDQIAHYLQSEGVDKRIVNNVQVVFEDAMQMIKAKNKKRVVCECTVLLSDSQVRLITKDNGKIFDLVKEADDSHDFRAYVLARMQSTAKEATYSVTTSFNRNACIWER